jgi:proteasome alpha subunit
MTDEPYRWLEAVANRREYIRDQLKGATPVFAFSRPEGILLVGVGTGQSKIFEVYDRHALAALGHPVDIEKVRQTVIEAAHLEGFSRAPEDVTLRRLLNSSLGPLLKATFEQIFAAPLIVETILAEVGSTPSHDTLARVSYDGAQRLVSGGIVVAHTNPSDEAAATEWLGKSLTPESSLDHVVRQALAASRELTGGKPFAAPTGEPLPLGAGKILEVALLDRRLPGRVRYRPLDPAKMS